MNFDHHIAKTAFDIASQAPQIHDALRMKLKLFGDNAIDITGKVTLHRARAVLTWHFK